MIGVSACSRHLWLSLAAGLFADTALAQPPDPTPSQRSKQWPVAPWVSLAPARRAERGASATLPPTLDAFAPLPEEIIVTERRHIQDLAPLISGIDASNPWTLAAAQPAVRNLQTFCEDKGPSNTACFDMAQVPIRTRLIRLSAILFSE